MAARFCCIFLDEFAGLLVQENLATWFLKLFCHPF